jgi:hypothetical protein
MNSKNKVGNFIFAFLLLAGAAACGRSFSPPTPTNTPAPTGTDTPFPTETKTPLPTNTSSPTSTPNLKATQAVENEQAVRDVLAELELPADSGHLGWYQEKPITIGLQGPAYKLKTFNESFSAADFVLYTEITWKTDSWPVCGVFFRADKRLEKGNAYSLQFLRFSGLPAWDIEYLQDGQWVTTITSKLKFSDYLKNDDGSTNKLVLTAIGNEFKFYLNDNFEGKFNDWSNKASKGNIAFSANNNAGTTKCIFDKSWVWIYK